MRTFSPRSDGVTAEDDSARSSVATHLLLSLAATIAAIAIAFAELALIVRQRWLWATGVVLGVVAVGFLVYGVTTVVA